MLCAWPGSCCLSGAAGYSCGGKSSHQGCQKSERDRDPGRKVIRCKFSNFSSVFSFLPLSHSPFWNLSTLLSPLRSSCPLFQEHNLVSPPGSGWECCTPSVGRALRGCKAAGRSELSCVWWETHHPATRKIKEYEKIWAKLTQEIGIRYREIKGWSTKVEALTGIWGPRGNR